jgi:hypothetical protein
MKLAHIINPVKPPVSSDLGIVQPVTFESIRIAHQFADGRTDVELYSISYTEDHEIIPPIFKMLPDLTRSVLDLGQFTRPRKYPIMMDVFKALYEASDADYLIFTNMDIALMPQFYAVVSEILKDGYDALLINRRGISTQYKSVAQLPLMYSEYGHPHPGFDCFIFRRELVNKFQLENICVGVSYSEVALVHNFIAFAEKLKLVDDLHLTFHIGTEVMPPLDPEYYGHNRNEYEKKIYPRIKPLLNIRKFPYALLPFHKRILKWMLNPSFRTHQVLEMEGKGFLRRLKYKLDAVRFRMLDGIR